MDMVLYHASPAKDLALLRPQRTLSKDIHIGNYVFATKDRKLAVMYLCPKGFPVILNSAESRIIAATTSANFKKLDKGGAIYTLPADSFHPTPQQGLENYEMVSSVPVEPLKKMVYGSTLEAFQTENINIYFVKRNMFTSLLKNKNESEVVAGLTPYRAR